MDEHYVAQYARLAHEHWWWQSRQSLVLRSLRELLAREAAPPADRTILDIGCADGVLFNELSRLGEVYGIECDSTLRDQAARWKTQIECTRFDADYVSQRKYDAVLMLDVLEHIADDRGALARVFQLLKPGGVALITVPALPWLWSTHDDVNHHFRRYDRPRIRQALASTGFDVLEARYFFTWSLGLVYLRKWLLAGKRQTYTVSIPPAPVNWAFRSISLCEQRLTETLRMHPPAGSSLLAIGRRT
jgi:2-polyprenyl-3-methyl-5-hydroxy-6-metoxy-1,4-benzoquinol methylase